MAQSDIAHASCVSFRGRGLLILGASGSGKSALALALMGFGADLVSDDRCALSREGRALWAAPPAGGVAGLIEARGLGILQADHVAKAQLHAVVDLDRLATERLPRHQGVTLLGVTLPCFAKVEAAHFAPALIQFLKGGALDPDAAFFERHDCKRPL